VRPIDTRPAAAVDMPVIEPPIAPMLARLVRELPIGDMTYEPKWDGFRCIAFAGHDAIDLRSRHDRPLSRYFPELVSAFNRLVNGRAETKADPGFVVDGEILLDRRDDEDDEADFALLMRRLHPAASRVERLSHELPARFIAFDLLADGVVDLRDRPFAERRARLVSLLGGGADVISVTTATRDPAEARAWLDAPFRAIDGVVAKPDDIAYEPGRRTMIKVKRQRTADCVVAGVRPVARGEVGTLLLGLYDEGDELRHVGVVTQLSAGDRTDLARELSSLVIPLERHPWSAGFAIEASPLGRLPGSAARWTPDMEHDWVPVRPNCVVEVAFDQVDGQRFRHPARFVRIRADRIPSSCGLDQITRSSSSGPDGSAP
jgi:ATP-dependent DNA ligase